MVELARRERRDRAARRPARPTLGDRLLTLAAVAGSVCLVLVVLAVAANVSLIMFRTGSMSPTIPTGSLAVVREVPTRVVELDDVVTVERPGRLPVTHRVVGIAEGDPVTLTLQGDANPAPDSETYQVETVRRVMWSVPGLGRVVGRMQHPYAIGGAAAVVALLVTWGLWPRTREDEES